MNFIVCQIFSENISSQQERKFVSVVTHYFLYEPYLFKTCSDQMIKCVTKEEMFDILVHCHSTEYGNHFGSQRTTMKVLPLGFYWPTLYKDANSFMKKSDTCQTSGNISRKQEMPFLEILQVKLFDVWGINFMGLFVSSNSKLYILVAVGYDTKWVEAQAFPTRDAKIVTRFLKKNIFTTRF